MVHRSGSEFVSARRLPAMMLEADVAATLDRVGAYGSTVETRSAVTPRRLAAHQDTPPILPNPIAINAVVVTDFAARTLYVRLPDHTTGLQRAAWEKGYQALVQSNDGYQLGAPTFWAATKSASQVARGAAGEANMVKFFFPVGGGNTAFSELVGKTGLAAIVTADRATGWFMRCLFLHRP